VALAGDDYLASDDSLDALLDELEGEADDVAIWREGCRLAAVIHGGVVQRFEREGPPEASLPAPAPGPRGGRRDLPRGRKPAALARWMGAAGWDLGQARSALARLGVDMSEDAIRTELALGHTGRGRLPKLSAQEASQLRQLLGQAGGGG
jgi:hypothetical protein